MPHAVPPPPRMDARQLHPPPQQPTCARGGHPFCRTGAAYNRNPGARRAARQRQNPPPPCPGPARAPQPRYQPVGLPIGHAMGAGSSRRAALQRHPAGHAPFRTARSAGLGRRRPLVGPAAGAARFFGTAAAAPGAKPTHTANGHAVPSHPPQPTTHNRYALCWPSRWRCVCGEPRICVMPMRFSLCSKQSPALLPPPIDKMKPPTPWGESLSPSLPSIGNREVAVGSRTKIINIQQSPLKHHAIVFY